MWDGAPDGIDDRVSYPSGASTKPLHNAGDLGARGELGDAAERAVLLHRPAGRRAGGQAVSRGRPVAAAAAALDAINRDQRAGDRAAFDDERRETAAIDARLDELNELADLVARAALLAAGYRRHHRGEWRKKRAHNEETT
jgi:hypothetical protein